MMSSTVSAATITVDDSGSGDHTIIQAAINAANDSDTILVYPGIYTENVDVNKELTIKSQTGNPDDTVVQANVSNDHVFNVTSNNVTIKGFNISGANDAKVAGIYLDEANTCTIANNSLSSNYYGIYVYYSNNSTINDNSAYLNKDSGLRLTNSNNNVVNNNTANLNNIFGIHVINTHPHSNYNVLNNNSVSNNEYGIHLGATYNNTLINNIAFLNTDSGIYLGKGQENILKNNIVHSNGFIGIQLSRSSNNTLDDNIAINNSRGVQFSYSNNNTLNNNTANQNTDDGIGLFRSNNNLMNNNTANLNKGDGIRLDWSSNNTFHHNNVSFNDEYGIFIGWSSNILQGSHYNILSNNIVNSNKYVGIKVYYSCNNLLYSNNVNSDGNPSISLYVSNNNEIINNNVNETISIDFSNNNELNANNVSNGIYLHGSNNNVIIYNTASSKSWIGMGISLYNSNNNEINANENHKAINLQLSDNNTFKNNNVLNNLGQGMRLIDSSNNLIYNNYFNNTNNVVFFGYNVGNVWNITKTSGTNIVGGPFLGGNFWANTTATGFSQINVDTDGDGFCDSQFDFAGNTDYLPLHLYEDSELTPIEKTEALKEYVDDLDEEVADASTKHVLNVKLDNVIDKLNKGDNGKAIKKLEDFIKFVGIMERQDKLEDGEAAYLINEANRIIEFIQNSAE